MKKIIILAIFLCLVLGTQAQQIKQEKKCKFKISHLNPYTSQITQDRLILYTFVTSATAFVLNEYAFRTKSKPASVAGKVVTVFSLSIPIKYFLTKKRIKH